MTDAAATTETPTRSLAANGAGLAPLMKWPGGKGSELPQILAAAPTNVDRYFEPFLGGGAVFFATSPEVPALVNDTSRELMHLYQCVGSGDRRFLSHLDDIRAWWDGIRDVTETAGGDLVDLFVTSRRNAPSLPQRSAEIVTELLPHLRGTVPPSWREWQTTFAQYAHRSVPIKVARMRKVEEERGTTLPLDDVWRNVEGALKAACYTTLREAYNAGRATSVLDARQAALFFYLREYAYAAMFRFNRRGEFNVPYGGITYNRKDMKTKIDRMTAPATLRRLASTTLACEDFETFLGQHEPGPNDFVFFDPPYDSDFSDYDANGFDRSDHARLADVMKRLAAPFQLVVKSTPAVLDLYSHPDWKVQAFNKKYMWTIKERNDRNATHLMITNY